MSEAQRTITGEDSLITETKNSDANKSGSDAKKPGPTGKETRFSHPLVELTLARMKEFVREPEAVFWVFIFPVLMVTVLGIAFRNAGPTKVRVAVEATTRTTGAPEIAIFNALKNSSDVDPELMSPEDAKRSLRAGKVPLVVRVSDSSRATTPSGQVPKDFDYRFDPTRPESRNARFLVDDALQRALGRADITQAGQQKITEPGARYIDFLIPGLLGLNLMGSGLWGIGFSIVSSRLRKLLKLFAATPMQRTHYLFSFMLSRLFFLVLEVAAVLLFARFAFGYTIHGSVLSMIFILVLGAMCFSGMGLLVASRPQTIEGVSGLMNFTMMPMWLMSGTFFSSGRFPSFIQPFIKILPLTALNDSLRSVMNEGTSITESGPALLVMALWGGICFFIALKIFRWQ
jgi:ABC-type multidrug transport system permease subunit